jgi:hypothetical protein
VQALGFVRRLTAGLEGCLDPGRAFEHDIRAFALHPEMEALVVLRFALGCALL